MMTEQKSTFHKVVRSIDATICLALMIACAIGILSGAPDIISRFALTVAAFTRFETLMKDVLK